jgi:hypothetical protein
MAQELKPLGKKRCYACIQWEGLRTIMLDKNGKKVLKVDIGAEFNCAIHHCKMRGNKTCDQFFPIQ